MKMDPDSKDDELHDTGGMLGRGEIPAALAAWAGGYPQDVEVRRLQEGLYRMCARLAAGVMGDASDLPDREGVATSMDLAHGFLHDVLAKGESVTIETRSGLRTAIKRHWHRMRNPAARELWETLSEALTNLAKEGNARRLDANWETARNHNGAQWTSSPDTEGLSHADLGAFETRCEDVPRCAPPTQGWLPEGKKPRKVISPSRAAELAAKLLDCAEGWVSMGELFAAFRQKVHCFDYRELDETSASSFEDGYVPEREESLLALAGDLAARIWGKVEASGLARVLCRYFLPKFFRHQEVTLQSLGASSTVGDQSDEVKRILAQELAPADLLPADAECDIGSRWHGRLVTETMEALETFCPCPPEK